MILKIVLLFLLFIAVLGMFGKLHWIGADRIAAKRCRTCGRYRIGRIGRATLCPCRSR